ncbi:2-keto-3-deoxygluconate permease [Clostridium saccharobutylicum]|uniref:2-keto-3-deoxygluconate permease 2 n=1 Tax=Clostridium saccharobutylicum DSM 13864 TaxID=1345695 RepID=U5MN48_CLOSA|nr:2-keto-3-deoxygluconate permease [Clostridium saccharobutylicum]AGX42000.1 2-keto-3-deoxygluconate permease 2 [Clostridium saccharobutylicum DSM 13864]AQR89278.1 2-keto-3-deoxygluconate permease [Clostridium saccharobutylicum]AQR99179.1 2-keto-3-deoxygluconate permease [Clostridium saccharobutylicum]AQS13167.1 2-keto-3-deoxygluconate permease [Clostridium saccharobutylicum]MBA2906224.1 2-keto-3-deoxygluconate permease [Clostridium saccharobutylicum]
MQIPIKKTLDKIPGGMMVVPLFIGVLVNTFCPQFLQIGGFTTALFGPKASSTILACFMFLIGSQINFKLAPKAIKKGVLLVLGQFIVGAGIGIFVGKVFGPAGVLGLSPLAILAALTNCNGGLYASLASQYGNETDVGAYAILSIKDGPFFTLVALGASGLAQIPFMSLVAVLIPILIGMILGNLDTEMRKFLGGSKLLLIPFFSFSLGAGMNLGNIVTAGGPGIVLGIIATFTGIGSFLLMKLFGENPVLGLATGSTSGNAVATPIAVAATDPTLITIATAATAQVAASCVISAIVCPFIVTYVFKFIEKNKVTQLKKEDIA